MKSKKQSPLQRLTLTILKKLPQKWRHIRHRGKGYNRSFECRFPISEHISERILAYSADVVFLISYQFPFSTDLKSFFSFFIIKALSPKVQLKTQIFDEQQKTNDL